MSKEHSDQDTRLTPNKFILSRKTNSVVAETQRAVQHYIHFRKEELQSTRKQFLELLQKQRQTVKKGDKYQEETQRIERRKKKKKKQIAKPKPQRQIERRNRLRRIDYRERSSSSQISLPKMAQKRGIKCKSPQKSDKQQGSQSQSLSFQEKNDESSFEAVGTFEIRPVHECLLQLQRTIDSFLDYQYVHRKRRSVSSEELFEFLKTTKYGLNCRKYFEYLKKYNYHLYLCKKDRIICKQLRSREIEQRCLETRNKMTQKEITELLI